MDCQQGLLCHQRSSFEAVPGCTCGESDGSASDYCIYPPPPPVIESNNFPLALCEGDCDTDVSVNLLAFSRDCHPTYT